MDHKDIEIILGVATIGALIGYIIYLKQGGTITPAVITKTITNTVTKMVPGQAITKTVNVPAPTKSTVSQSKAITQAIVGAAAPIIAFEAQRSTQQIVDVARSIVNDPTNPASYNPFNISIKDTQTIATDISSSSTESFGNRGVDVLQSFSSSGVVPAAAYFVAKAFAAGFRGASQKQQQAILGQTTVSSVQMIVGVIPIAGMFLSPLVGILAQTKIGGKVVANVAVAEEQAYIMQKQIISGHISQAFSGGGSSHAERVAKLGAQKVMALNNILAQSTGPVLTTAQQASIAAAGYTPAQIAAINANQVYNAQAQAAIAVIVAANPLPACTAAMLTSLGVSKDVQNTIAYQLAKGTPAWQALLTPTQYSAMIDPTKNWDTWCSTNGLVNTPPPPAQVKAATSAALQNQANLAWTLAGGTASQMTAIIASGLFATPQAVVSFMQQNMQNTPTTIAAQAAALANATGGLTAAQQTALNARIPLSQILAFKNVGVTTAQFAQLAAQPLNQLNFTAVLTPAQYTTLFGAPQTPIQQQQITIQASLNTLLGSTSDRLYGPAGLCGAQTTMAKQRAAIVAAMTPQPALIPVMDSPFMTQNPQAGMILAPLGGYGIFNPGSPPSMGSSGTSPGWYSGNTLLTLPTNTFGAQSSSYLVGVSPTSAQGKAVLAQLAAQLANLDDNISSNKVQLAAAQQQFKTACAFPGAATGDYASMCTTTTC